MSRFACYHDALARFLQLANDPISSDSYAELNALLEAFKSMPMPNLAANQQDLLNFQRSVFQLAASGNRTAASYAMSNLAEFRFPAYCMGAALSTDNRFVKKFFEAQARLLSASRAHFNVQSAIMDDKATTVAAGFMGQCVDSSIKDLSTLIKEKPAFDVRLMIMAAMKADDEKLAEMLVAAVLHVDVDRGMSLVTECIEFFVVNNRLDVLCQLIGRMPEVDMKQYGIVRNLFLTRPDDALVMKAYYLSLKKIGMHAIGEAGLLELTALIQRMDNDFAQLQSLQIYAIKDRARSLRHALTLLLNVDSGDGLKSAVVQLLLAAKNMYLTSYSYMEVMAMVYEQGLGVAADADLARQYWRTAADLGSEEGFKKIYPDAKEPHALYEIAKKDCGAAYRQLVKLAKSRKDAEHYVEKCIRYGHGVDSRDETLRSKSSMDPEGVNTLRTHDGSQLDWLTTMVRLNLLLMGGTGRHVTIKQFDLYAGFFKERDVHRLLHHYLSDYVATIGSDIYSRVWQACIDDIAWSRSFIKSKDLTGDRFKQRLDAGYVIPLTVAITDFDANHMINLTFYMACKKYFLIVNDKQPGLFDDHPGMQVFRIRDISVLESDRSLKSMIQQCADKRFMRRRYSSVETTMHQLLDTDFVFSTERKPQVGDECVPQAEMVKVLSFMLAKASQFNGDAVSKEMLEKLYPMAKQQHRQYRNFVRRRAQDQLLHIIEHYKTLDIPYEQVSALMNVMKAIVKEKRARAMFQYVEKYETLSGMFKRLDDMSLGRAAGGNDMLKHPALLVEDDGVKGAEFNLAPLVGLIVLM